ncbi:hypothetical protein RCL_jg27685.t1 [Rhizophagus clarus]|uniref:Uncharacterized protein n=1 Tax=Rhizophagus clarus TaxID=94130 RepID=A0A8H3QD16_9GLOM|nr:hypothetical protein RCL_jg27685.t1 [Rhizophagus clarus]
MDSYQKIVIFCYFVMLNKNKTISHSIKGKDGSYYGMSSHQKVFNLCRIRTKSKVIYKLLPMKINFKANDQRKKNFLTLLERKKVTPYYIGINYNDLKTKFDSFNEREKKMVLY